MSAVDVEIPYRGTPIGRLFLEAAGLGITVRFSNLAALGVIGFYDDDRNTITLDYNLSPIQLRSTLAHELIHARRRDTNPLVEHELRTDEDAARLLIKASAYRDAYERHGDNIQALGAELFVSWWIVEAAHRIWLPYERLTPWPRRPGDSAVQLRTPDDLRVAS